MEHWSHFHLHQSKKRVQALQLVFHLWIQEADIHNELVCRSEYPLNHTDGGHIGMN